MGTRSGIVTDRTEGMREIRCRNGVSVYVRFVGTSVEVNVSFGPRSGASALLDSDQTEELFWILARRLSRTVDDCDKGAGHDG